MTTRLRTSNLEQESNFEDEGVGELSVEEKYAEVKQLIAIGKEKGFLLYDEIYEVLPEEITSLPEELDEIYIRFNDLGIDVDRGCREAAPGQLPRASSRSTARSKKRRWTSARRSSRTSSRPPAASSTRPTIPCACTCARWARSSSSTARAKSTSPSASRRASARSTRRSPQNRIILEEILKIYESAKKDARVIKETIDLAMPDDDGTTIDAADDDGEPKLPAAAVNKIDDIMVIFERHRQARQEDQGRRRSSCADPKKLSERTLATTLKSVDRKLEQRARRRAAAASTSRRRRATG